MVSRIFSFSSVLLLAASLFADEEVIELDPLFVSANRFDPTAERIASPVSNFSLQVLQSDQFRDVSDALSSYPGFASFRRTHAVAAHPTTQGVRLRNVGANATSRALVLYDGVPQNDPFGSWIFWHQFDLAQVEHISIRPGGSGEQWGNMASGGLISLISQKPVPGSGQLQVSVGSSDRYDLHAGSTWKLSEGIVFNAGIRTFSTDGFYTLREDQRGSIDIPANSETTVATASLHFDHNENWSSNASLRYFEESRSNGTPLAQNDSEAFDLAFVSQRYLPSLDATLNFNSYFQDRKFRNVFTSVTEDRSSESPALDQFAVPATSYGAAFYYSSESNALFSYSIGTDFRFIEGTVNERFRNLGNGFTRQRRAGGEQVFWGAFASTRFSPNENDTLSLSARLDQVSQNKGHRTETNTTNDTILRNDDYSDRRDEIASASLNWKHQFTEKTASNLTAFSGFRAPTLNELYRPFRVRNDITESNPLLSNERTQGLEIGFTTEPFEATALRLSAFSYELNETIANALVTTESGFDPQFGFIPEGGSGSIRANIDKSTVSGFELQVNQQVSETIFLFLGGVYAKSEIENDEFENLKRNSFPQSPPWKATASLDWNPNETWSAWMRYSWSDRSYENLSNTIRLGATSDLSLGVRYELSENSSISFAVTNVFDELNVTGIASNGLVTIDEPREILLTFRWKK